MICHMWSLIGKRYLGEAHTHRKRKRSACIKEHGGYLILLPDRKKTFWVCRLCDAKGKTAMSDVQSTNAAQEHIRKEHQIKGQDNDEEDSAETSRRDVLAMQRMAARGSQITKTKDDSFKAALASWVVDQNVPLKAVEHASFRDLLTLLAVDDNFLPKSHATIGKWLMAEFDQKRMVIKEQLHEDSISKIHLTLTCGHLTISLLCWVSSPTV